VHVAIDRDEVRLVGSVREGGGDAASDDLDVGSSGVARVPVGTGILEVDVVEDRDPDGFSAVRSLPGGRRGWRGSWRAARPERWLGHHPLSDAC
jgi:hypothetical protein